MAIVECGLADPHVTPHSRLGERARARERECGGERIPYGELGERARARERERLSHNGL